MRSLAERRRDAKEAKKEKNKKRAARFALVRDPAGAARPTSGAAKRLRQLSRSEQRAAAAAERLAERRRPNSASFWRAVAASDKLNAEAWVAAAPAREERERELRAAFAAAKAGKLARTFAEIVAASWSSLQKRHKLAPRVMVRTGDGIRCCCHFYCMDDGSDGPTASMLRRACLDASSHEDFLSSMRGERFDGFDADAARRAAQRAEDDAKAAEGGWRSTLCYK